MNLFDAPIVHDDHALRACYAALDMQASVKAYAAETNRSHLVEVYDGLRSGQRC